MPAPSRHLSNSLVLAAAFVLTACGGGSDAGSQPSAPGLTQPGAPLVRVSQASPFPASCGGALPGSRSYEDAEVEPYVAVDPTNTAHLIGVWQQDRWSDGGAHGLMSGYSLDGGRHWTLVPLPFSQCAAVTGAGTGYARASDPWVTFAPDGTAYAISISFTGDTLQPGSKGAVLVTRSADGGASWSDPAVLIADGVHAFDDKEAITADANDSHLVYAVWDRLTDTGLGPTYFSRTTDGGASWEAARVIYDPGLDNQTIGNEIMSLPDGSIVDFFDEIDGTSGNAATSRIRVLRSVDQGVTWSAPVTVAANESVGTVDPEDTRSIIRSGAGLPQAAVGPGGELVVVWQDARFSGGRRDAIALARSTDGGRHWSAPVRINSTPAAAAFTPSVAVLADGTLGVSYFDFRNDTPDVGTLPTDYWFVSSTDGVAWREQHISGPFDMDLAPEAEGLFIGDYQALAVIGQAFVPFYVQTDDAGTANRDDAWVLPPQPVPLALSRRVTHVAAAAPEAAPDAAFRARMHASAMQLLRGENPGWDRLREARRRGVTPP